MKEVRKKILEDFSKWTVLSALRSGSPIKSREDIYPLVEQIKFKDVCDESKGFITKDEFEKWHKDMTEFLVNETSKLNKQYGWAVKIINIYLKTYCYIGGSGRDGLLELLHPPIDRQLLKGVKSKFEGDLKILRNIQSISSIKDISSYETYTKIIQSMRDASSQLGCSLIEMEQFWEGTIVN